jgi:hypothetical protein
MEKLDFGQGTTLTTLTFKEQIDWKTLIKMLLSDNILQTNRIFHQKTNTEYFYENERQQLEDILRKGMIVRKHWKQPITKNLLHIYYNHTDKYLRPFIQVKYFYDRKKKRWSCVSREKFKSM